eukprot:Nk52_evm4s1178 gene=Nk52_evmTU4s1178
MGATNEAPTIISLAYNGCVLVAGLAFFSFFRFKRAWIYFHRFLVATVPPPKLRLGPFEWITQTFSIPDGCVLQSVGMDGYFFLRYIWLWVRVSGIVGFVSMLVLLPIYRTGGLDQVGLNRFMIINTNHEYALWIAVVMLYVTVSFSLYEIRKLILDLREIREQYLKCNSAPEEYSVLVLGLDEEIDSEAKLACLFNRMYPGCIYRVSMVRYCSKLGKAIRGRDSVIFKMDRLHAKINKLEAKIDSAKESNPKKVEGLEKQKAAVLKEWEKAKDRLREVNEKLIEVRTGKAFEEGEEDDESVEESKLLRKMQWRKHKTYFEKYPNARHLIDASVAEAESLDFDTEGDNPVNYNTKNLTREQIKLYKNIPYFNAGFVTFSSRSAAAAAIQVVHSHRTGSYRVEQAPQPKAVYWGPLTMDRKKRRRRKFLSALITFTCIAFYAVPALLLQKLAQIDTTSDKNDSTDTSNDNTDMSKAAVSGVLPSLLLSLTVGLIPTFVELLARFAGYYSRGLVDSYVYKTMRFYQFFNVFLVAVIGGAVINQLDEIKENGLSRTLGENLPGQSTFFFNYLVYKICTGFPLELLNFYSQLSSTLKLVLKFTKRQRDATKILGRSKKLGKRYATILVFVLIYMSYCTIAPLLVLPSIAYFCGSYIVYKYQLLYVYSPSYEDGGMLFPAVIKDSVYSVLFAIAAVGGLFSFRGQDRYAYACIPIWVVAILYVFYIDRLLSEFRFLGLMDGCIEDEERQAAREVQGNSTGDLKCLKNCQFTNLPFLDKGDAYIDPNIAIEPDEWQPYTHKKFSDRLMENCGFTSIFDENTVVSPDGRSTSWTGNGVSDLGEGVCLDLENTQTAIQGSLSDDKMKLQHPYAVPPDVNENEDADDAAEGEADIHELKSPHE